jgi:NitT/TauT family transport system ATP-binding protein
MKMRASLARTLTMRPPVFLFDEPFGAVDEITRERLNDELLRLFASQGFAALFITHSVSEAVFLSSRVAVMSGRPGRIVGEVAVPFAYPRAPELRFSPEFARLAGVVSAMLRTATDTPIGSPIDSPIESATDTPIDSPIGSAIDTAS